MRLLILTQKVDSTDDNLGFFHRWIEEFAKQCESVIVVCLYEGKHSLPKNVRVLSLGKESGISRIKYLSRFYSYIWRERKNYDSVFVHMNQIYAILAGVLWRLWGKRVSLWYVHGSVTLSLRLATLFVHTVFTSTVESFRINTPKRYIVGHGIDDWFFKTSRSYEKKETIRAVTVGRISPVKDLRTTLDAVKILHEKNVKVHVRIIGAPVTNRDRDYLESLTEEVKDKKLEDTITFVGPILHTALPSELQTSDIFIHTSMTGSLDKTALEAMATGMPIVTSNESVISIIPERVRNDLVIPQGDPSALASHLVELSSLSQQERERMGTELRENIQTFYTVPRLITDITRLL